MAAGADDFALACSGLALAASRAALMEGPGWAAAASVRAGVQLALAREALGRMPVASRRALEESGAVTALADASALATPEALAAGSAPELEHAARLAIARAIG